MALENAPFLLYTSDYSDASNGSILSGSTSIRVISGGSQSPTVISVQGFLESLTTLVSNFAGTGFLCTNTAGSPLFRTINGGSGINVTSPNGLAGNLSISQMPLTTPQIVQISNTVGAVTENAQSLVFTGSGGIIVTVSDVSSATFPAQYQINVAGTGGLGTVTNVGAASTTGLTFSVDNPTTTPVVTFNLPGSGLVEAVIHGDILLGNNSGAYDALGIGAANTVLTSNGTTASWQPPTPDTPWYTVPNPTAPNGSTVDMGNHNINNLGQILFSPVASSPAPAGTGILGIDTDADNHLYFNMHNVPAQYVVTTHQANYSSPFCILFGSPTAGLNYSTTTVAPTSGQVVGFDGTTVKWIENTVNILPSGIVQFDNSFPSDDTYENYPYKFVADTNLTENSIVLVSGSQAGNQTAAAGCFIINDYNNSLGNGEGFYIVGASDQTASNGTAVYQIIQY